MYPFSILVIFKWLGRLSHTWKCFGIVFYFWWTW
jgi:hypothetical protein